MGTNDLTRESFREAAVLLRLEKIKLITCLEAESWRDIAYPPLRQEHLSSYWDDDLGRLDVWVHWDGRAHVEAQGRTILRFWAPAGELLKDVKHRKQSHLAANV